MADDESEQLKHLPPGVALAWGMQPAGRRGPKPGLSLDAIVLAAIEVADEAGLAAVSMHSVAKRLDFTAMSLYRYLKSKDDLLALMMDAGFGEPPVTVRQATGWRAVCQVWSEEILIRYLAHPWLLDIPIMSAPMMPRQMLWLEQALEGLTNTGLTEVEKLSVALLLSTYVMNVARLERDINGNREFTEAESVAGYEQTLADLLAPATYPHLLRAVQAGAFSAEDIEHHEFTFGLDRILDGIEVLIARRSAVHPSS